jgi:hypothetical protein
LAEAYRLPGESQVSCGRCTSHLGVLLGEEARLASIWPALSELDDDDEPEPTVRLSDGSKVELRQRTEELKKDLTPSQRVELMDTYVKLGLGREAVLEAAQVLKGGERDDREKVLALLFSPPLAAPDALERLRPFLLPV